MTDSLFRLTQHRRRDQHGTNWVVTKGEQTVWLALVPVSFIVTVFLRQSTQTTNQRMKQYLQKATARPLTVTYKNIVLYNDQVTVVREGRLLPTEQPIGTEIQDDRSKTKDGDGKNKICAG
jgi:hypothetical protein